VTVKDYLAPVRLTSGLHYYYYVTRHASQNLALHELFLCPAILLAAAPRWSTAREAARHRGACAACCAQLRRSSVHL